MCLDTSFKVDLIPDDGTHKNTISQDLIELKSVMGIILLANFKLG
jgi:hypothetical protein